MPNTRVGLRNVKSHEEIDTSWGTHLKCLELCVWSLYLSSGHCAHHILSFRNRLQMKASTCRRTVACRRTSCYSGAKRRRPLRSSEPARSWAGATRPLRFDRSTPDTSMGCSCTKRHRDSSSSARGTTRWAIRPWNLFDWLTYVYCSYIWIWSYS